MVFHVVMPYRPDIDPIYFQATDHFPSGWNKARPLQNSTVLLLVKTEPILHRRNPIYTPKEEEGHQQLHL